MVLEAERWLELRRFRALRRAEVSISEIARETGLNWRTVKKYLEADGPAAPPEPPPRADRGKQMIAAYAPVIDVWLRAELLLKGTVIHERLAGEYGFTGNYQRVKMYLQEARPRIAAELGYTPSELARLHRRFEVVPGAQAQVDWGDEGGILAHAGIAKVYSFHMVLSYSRDPFCCFTTSQDLATFWACHRRAFAHFGGVPGSIVYDRTKTVVRRHVAPGQAVPLHPEAVAFAGHYGFDIDVLAAYRPTGKGRVERQVTIVRDHVLAGRVCQIFCARGFSLSGTGCLSGVLCSRYLMPWCPVYPAASRNRTYCCFRGQILRVPVFAAFAVVPGARCLILRGSHGGRSRLSLNIAGGNDRGRVTRSCLFRFLFIKVRAGSAAYGCRMPVWSSMAWPRSAAAMASPMCSSARLRPSGASSAFRASAAGLAGQGTGHQGGVAEQVSDLLGVQGVQRDAPGAHRVAGHRHRAPPVNLTCGRRTGPASGPPSPPRPRASPG